jgi:hypothetical protein
VPAGCETGAVPARIVLAALASLALAPPGAAAPSPARLLAAYAPVVLLHPDERFAPVAVEPFLAASALERRTDSGWQAVERPALPDDPGPWRLNQRACVPSVGVASIACYAATPPGPATVYARATRTRDRIVLQYWLFYAYDFWSGRFPPSDYLWQAHEGDWEAVAVVLTAAGRPLRAGYSQHCSGQRRAWARVPRQGTHPLVHVALGSHSSWFEPGDHPIDTRCYPQAARVVLGAYLGTALDRTGTSRRTRPRVVPVTDSSPGWMRFRGTWGEEGWFHAPDPVNTVTYGAGPPGPAFHDLWRDPLRTIARWPEG